MTTLYTDILQHCSDNDVNSLEKLKLLWEKEKYGKHVKPFKNLIKRGFLCSAQNENLRVLEWICNTFECVDAMLNDVVHMVIRENKINSCEVLLELKPYICDSVFTCAVHKNNWDVLLLIYSKNYYFNTDAAFRTICFTDDEHLINVYCSIFSKITDNGYTHALMMACSCGKKETYEWLLKNKTFNDDILCRCFELACKHNNLLLFMHLSKKFPKIFSTNAISIFDHACKHSETILDLITRPINISNDAIISGFKKACLNGNIGGVKLMFRKCSHFIPSSTLGLIFFESCEHNNIHVIQWLYHRLPPKTLSDESLMNIAINACNHGQLEIVTWLTHMNFALYGELMASDVFAGVCTRNYLHVAKWLNAGNVIEWDCKLFYDCCYASALSVAKWLYKLKPMNITINNDQLICECVNRKCIKVIKWLSRLVKNRYKYTNRRDKNRLRINGVVYIPKN
jgi:hypothetical protein